ncbi:hypothetical protein EI94DRAFT_1764631, partial [Lactarius quietus]
MPSHHFSHMSQAEEGDSIFSFHQATRTAVCHRPQPTSDIPHKDFVSLMGPFLIP